MDMQEYYAKIEALLKRALLYAEDSEWDNARNCYELALDLDPENDKAYVGLLLTELQLIEEEDLSKSGISFSENKNYIKALRFADDEYSEILKNLCYECDYNRALMAYEYSTTASEFEKSKELFSIVSDYKDSKDYIAKCEQKQSEAVLEGKYFEASDLLKYHNIEKLRKAKEIFEELNYKDSKSKANECVEKINHIIKETEIKKKKFLKNVILCSSIALIVIIVAIIAKTNSNQTREKEIYDNMLGRTFERELTDDDGFFSEYKNNSSGSPSKMVYLWCEEKETYKFNNDGTVEWDYYENQSLLAYDKYYESAIDADDWKKNNHYDSTYEYFSIHVSLFGKVYLQFENGGRMELDVDSDNKPTGITDGDEYFS